MANLQGGPAQPVYLIDDSQLVENGGNFKVIGRVAVALQNDVTALPKNASRVTQALPYTVQSADAGKVVFVSGTGTLTLPNGLADGWQAVVIYTGAGTLTITATGTLRSPGGLNTITEQYGQVALLHDTANVWYIEGRLA